MRRALVAVLATSCLAGQALGQPKKDAPNCKDHPSFTRLRDYWIESCVQKPRDAYNFSFGRGHQMVEGIYSYIRYQPPAGLGAKPSAAELVRSLDAEIKKAGGELVYSDSSKETFKLRSAGKETWVEAWADHTGKYILTIVERPASGPDEAQAAIAPTTVTSPPIRIMGTRIEPMTVTTASIRIVGTRSDPLTLTTAALRIFGTASEPMTVTTAPIRIVGTRSDPLTFTTAALRIFGTGSEPMTVTTAPIRILGTRSEPLIVTTESIRIVGTRSNSLTVTTNPISVLGTRSDPMTITTQRILVVGVGEVRDGGIPNREIHDTKVPVDLKRK